MQIFLQWNTGIDQAKPVPDPPLNLLIAVMNFDNIPLKCVCWICNLCAVHRN